MTKIKNIIFDLDGTLWDSREEIIKAWKSVFPSINATSNELLALMGKSSDSFMKYLFPDCNPETAKNNMIKCEQEETKYLAKHGAKLYPNTIDTLIKLNKTHNLYIVSNCQKGYIESFLQHYKLKHLFKDIECIGNTNKSKPENINLVISRNNLLLDETCYVGDKEDDKKSAEANQITFIWSKYGFGSNIEAKYYLNKIEEITELIKTIQ